LVRAGEESVKLMPLPEFPEIAQLMKVGVEFSQETTWPESTRELPVIVQLANSEEESCPQ
jgi:hypothetical protein